MRVFGFVFLLLVSRCAGRSVPEDSVVSVYTTQPTTAGTGGLDVYQQIAYNVAERITSPIYRFLGIGKNKTDGQPLARQPWQKIELLDEPEDATKPVKPIDNEIDFDERDVEELSVEALKKIDNKPEKITLYSSYLPVQVGNLALNTTVNEIDDDDDDDEPFGFDDVEQTSDGPFAVILEVLSTVAQLAWSVIQGVFKSSASSDNNSNDSS